MFKRERKSTPAGCGIEEVLEKYKEFLDQIKFEDETQKRIFAICEEVYEIPRSTLARIGHLLNDWEWADELPGKPDGWDDMTMDEKFVWIKPIVETIEIEIGRKAILRYAHKTEYGVTDQEFDDWWDSKIYKELEQRNRYTDQGNDRGDYKTQYKQYFIRTVSLILSSLSLGIAITSLLL